MVRGEEASEHRAGTARRRSAKAGSSPPDDSSLPPTYSFRSTPFSPPCTLPAPERVPWCCVPQLLLSCLLVSASASTSEAVAPGWIRDTWTSADGLPIEHLNAVAVDAQGIVWIATYDGLVRFDGLSFETLRASDAGGPPSTRLLFVQTDPADGAVWVTTEDRQVQRRAGDQIDTVPAP